MQTTKLQKAGAVILILGLTSFGVAVIAAQPDTLGALEDALKYNVLTAQTAYEACQKTEIALAQAKLDAKGSGNMSTEDLARLKSKSKGENLSACSF
jgi:hypothetical protein